MRFSIEFTLNKDRIQKDKNRLFISFLKNCLENYDKNYYEELYSKDKNRTKDITFSLYMGKCEFLRDEIFIPDKKIYFTFSTYEIEDGILFYNSFINTKDSSFEIKNNEMKVKEINILQEKTIYDNEAIFKTLSPLVSREHKGDNKKTWYHSLKTKKGQEIFKENLIYQLIEKFGENKINDFENINIEISNNIREVKVKNYGIEVLGNIGKIKVNAKPYILDYIYKAGVGSKRSGGFGMVDLI